MLPNQAAADAASIRFIWHILQQIAYPQHLCLSLQKIRVIQTRAEKVAPVTGAAYHLSAPVVLDALEEPVRRACVPFCSLGKLDQLARF